MYSCPSPLRRPVTYARSVLAPLMTKGVAAERPRMQRLRVGKGGKRQEVGRKFIHLCTA